MKNTKQDASDHDAGHRHNAHRQSEGLQVGEQFLKAAVFTKLRPGVKQFDSAKIGAPFVIKRAILPATMNHPEAAAVDFDSVTV